MQDIAAFRWHPSSPDLPDPYLIRPVVDHLRALGAKRVLDLGCGNGRMSAAIAAAGFDVTGCDVSSEGIALARQRYPNCAFHCVSVSGEPPVKDFDVVVSTEVIEHLFLPRLLLRFAAKALKPQGHLIISTPYHGYLKNLVISLLDMWDRHLQPGADGGHIKFFSRRTLTTLIEEEGFKVLEVHGSGRVPLLWKSLFAVCRLH